ncbi:hypothetical protein WK48_09680 [Burkholderia ubonensis]|nr:hypothetical protein WK48_09680 [Burkholderia ubonensis]
MRAASAKSASESGRSSSVAAACANTGQFRQRACAARRGHVPSPRVPMRFQQSSMRRAGARSS